MIFRNVFLGQRGGLDTIAYLKFLENVSDIVLDRIDIHIEVPRVDCEKLSGDRVGESSESIRKRVQPARDMQLTRFTHPE
jgi:magnesium chelatase family protein